MLCVTGATLERAGPAIGWRLNPRIVTQANNKHWYFYRPVLGRVGGGRLNDSDD